MLKTFRDIRETIGSFISIVAVIMIGCFFFAGITAGSGGVTAQVEDYYDSSNYASARAEYMYINEPAVESMRETDGVRVAQGCNTFYTSTRIAKSRYDMTITTITDNVDEPYIVSGRLPRAGENGILIDKVTAEKHGIKAGDSIDFSIDTTERIDLTMTEQGTEGLTPQYTVQTKPVDYRFTVCGIYHTPDVIYKVNVRNTAALPDEFIFALVRREDIALFSAGATVTLNGFPVLSLDDVSVDVYNGVRIRDNGKVDREALFSRFSVSSAEEIKEMLSHTDEAAGLYMYMLERDNFPSVLAFNGLNDTIAALAAVLPFIFFAVAAAITVISMSKTVDGQRMQIGVIQAIGVSKAQVYFSYIFYALFACLIGGFAGGLIGIYFIPYLLDILYARQFCMPPTPRGASVLFLILGVVIATALACLAAFLSCHRTLKVQPAQAMRPKPPKNTRRILAERWTWLWKRLGFGAKMNLRNMFLHKLRMLLSSVGIVGCLALLIALIGLKDNMALSFDRYDESVNYDLIVAIESPLDLERFDLDEIADKHGAEYIRGLTFVPDFSARFTFGGRTADMNLMALPTASDAANYKYADADCVKVFTDVKGRDRLTFKNDTFAIPTELADELDIEKGDIVRVSGYSLDNRAVEFDVKVTDIVYQYFEQKAYCAYDLFANSGVGLYADTAYASIKNGASFADAISALREYDEVRDVRTFSEIFSSLEDKMEMLDYAVILFVIGAAVLAVAVIYNITSTNLKDRTREIATLMVLGYRNGETLAMVLVENLVITALGCILGLPLGYGLMIWLVYISSSFNVFISSILSWYVAIGCTVLTFAFSVLATLIFDRKIKNISMVEALKSVE